MSTLIDAVDAIAETVIDGTDLSQAHKLAIETSAIFPCFFVDAPEVDYTDLASGSMYAELRLVVFVSAVVGENRATLLEYMVTAGPKSIPQAFQSRRDLGIGADCHVLRGRPLNLTELQAYNAYGAVFTLALRMDLDPGS